MAFWLVNLTKLGFSPLPCSLCDMSISSASDMSIKDLCNSQHGMVANTVVNTFVCFLLFIWTTVSPSDKHFLIRSNCSPRITTTYYSFRSLSAALSIYHVSPLAMILKRSRIRMAQTKWTKHGYMCLWLPDVALNHDVEANLGPNTMPKCPSSGKKLKDYQEESSGHLVRQLRHLFSRICMGPKRRKPAN